LAMALNPNTLVKNSPLGMARNNRQVQENSNE